jgi:hypothetical protein
MNLRVMKEDSAFVGEEKDRKTHSPRNERRTAGRKSRYISSSLSHGSRQIPIIPRELNSSLADFTS